MYYGKKVHGKAHTFFAMILPSIHVVGDGLTPEQEILMEMLAKFYKQPKDKITEILALAPAEAKAAIAKLDTDRIAKIQEGVDNLTFQDGFKKGKKETMTEHEKAVREAYGLTESTAVGLDLINEAVAAKAGEAGAKTDDQIKGSTVYQQLEQKMKTELAKQKTDFETKLTEKDNNYQRETTFGSVAKKARDIRNGLNPIISENATIAETHDTDFVNELKGYEYKPSGETYLVYKDGKLQQDQHGNTLDFDAFVQSVAGKRYQFAANNGGGNSGATELEKQAAIAAAKAKEYPAGVTPPKNLDELALVLNRKDLKVTDKRKISDTYNAANVVK